jgi:NAD(P)H-hydrate epimerase
MALPVLSIAQMREWEIASWATGRKEAEVIQLVGQALARRALQLTREGDVILLLAGKGHNGDDARAAAPHLANREAHSLNVTDPSAQLGELQSALARRPALVIDALFGIGLNRPLDEHWQRFLLELNTAQLRVLAVDVPSGLNADTGEAFGAAVNAEITVTIGAPKQGLLCSAAWEKVGRLEVAENVGLIPCPTTHEALSWVQSQDFRGFPPARTAAAHKGNFGHLAIVAGSPGYHGAAVLATHAAQRAHAGLVTLHTLGEVYHAVAAHLQGAMVRIWSASAQLTPPHSAVLIGPGLAAREAPEQFSLATRKLWRDQATPVVVDASALDWLPLDPVPKGAIRVVTPHPGEAARLINTSAAQVQADRRRALREISHRLGDCWVILKGHHTLIGRSTGEIFVNSSGNPLLAQGGSGDLLAGYIAGLIAQPALQRDICKTLRYAVWQHGAAADQLTAQRPNWIVDELAAELGLAQPD